MTREDVILIQREDVEEAGVRTRKQKPEFKEDKNVRRKFVCVAMAMVMLFGFSVNVYAEEPKTVNPAEVVASGGELQTEEIMQKEATTAAACTHPQWTWECRRNYIGTKTNVKHKYGFLWANTCTSTVKLSTVRNFCYICKASMYWYDTNEQHECRQIHQDCGKGTEDICTIIGQYSIKEEIQ